MLRRLLYFVFGFILSILLLSIGPNNKLKQTFIAYINYFDIDKRVIYHLDKGDKTIFSELVECQIECYSFDKKKILNVLRIGEVNFKKSEKNTKPCQFYIVESQERDYFISVKFKYCSKSDIVEVVSFSLDIDQEQCHC
ncbi:MAG: hypothetical protein VX347_04565 [Bacteroidota bacterium]|nr:hypothetical protein [Bacteroidota bacterium]